MQKILFSKTYYSALEDPKNLSQMVLPLISFNPLIRLTISRSTQIDSKIFLDSISKELDTQTEFFLQKLLVNI